MTVWAKRCAGVRVVQVQDDQRDLNVVPCKKLGAGIDGLFRSEAQSYVGWPPESSTDGASIDVCVRSGPESLIAMGMAWIDCDGEKFPFRVELDRTSDGSAQLVVFIGQVDPATGAPPRLPSGTLLVPVRDEDGRYVGAELILGRSQIPIVWTIAYAIP